MKPIYCSVEEAGFRGGENRFSRLKREKASAELKKELRKKGKEGRERERWRVREREREREREKIIWFRRGKRIFL